MTFLNALLQATLVGFNLYMGFTRLHNGESPAASFAAAGFITMLCILVYIARDA